MINWKEKEAALNSLRCVRAECAAEPLGHSTTKKWMVWVVPRMVDPAEFIELCKRAQELSFLTMFSECRDVQLPQLDEVEQVNFDCGGWHTRAFVKVVVVENRGGGQ